MAKLSACPKSRDGLDHPFYEEGFHGDEHLLALIDLFVHKGEVESFIETGSGSGSTACYMARQYPGLSVFTCENDPVLYRYAHKKLRPYPNAYIREADSFLFLMGLRPEIYQRPFLCWLDAHTEGQAWPLPRELTFLVSKRAEFAYILIDDILIPGRPDFQHGVHDDQPASFENLKAILEPGRPYRAFQPTYSHHNGYHPLVGTLLVSYGLPLSDLSQFGFEEVLDDAG